MKEKIAIIIPCYNEGVTIYQSLQVLSRFLETQDSVEWVLVCVDDGSTDDTRAEITRFQERWCHETIAMVLVHSVGNQGKGAAIQKGVSSISADYYGYIDADLSIHYQLAIPEVLRQLKHSSIVIGERDELVMAGYSLFRRFASRFMTFFPRRFFGLSYTDPQCGFKFFHRSVIGLIQSIQQMRFSFDIEFLVRAKQAGVTVTRIPVTWTHRVKTSVRISDGIRYLIDLLPIMEVSYTSRRFVGIYAVVASTITLLVFGWTLWYGYFFSDDFTWLWHGAKIARGEIDLLRAHMSTFYSPVLNAFYTLFYTLFSYHASIYFFFGLLVHIGTAVLLGILTRILSRSALAGLFATTLFSFAGGAYEPLVWIGANMHSLVAFFMVGSVLSLVLFLKQTRARWLYASLSVVSFILALGTKEIAVALPPILLLIAGYYLYQSETKRKIIFSLLILVFPMLGIFGWYISMQYLWQKSSVWVESGAFSFSVDRLLHIPLALVDMLVPLTAVISVRNAGWLLVISTILIGVFIRRFRRNSVVWFGLGWSIFAILPVLFFNADAWWSVLPSRYTYTARIGVVLALAVVLVELLRSGKQLRLVHRLFWVLACLIVVNIANTANIVSSQYGYVYETGRALTLVSEELRAIQPEKVVVKWYRPFNQNYAHMIGAFDIIAKIPEERVVFLQKDELYTPKTGEVVVGWSDKELKFFIFR